MDKEQEGKIMCCSLTIFVPTASANFTTSLLSFVPASWHCASVQLAIYKSWHCASVQLTIYKSWHCASVQLTIYKSRHCASVQLAIYRSRHCASVQLAIYKSWHCASVQLAVYRSRQYASVQLTIDLQKSTLSISTTCYLQKSTLCIRTTCYLQKLTLCVRTTYYLQLNIQSSIKYTFWRTHTFTSDSDNMIPKLSLSTPINSRTELFLQWWRWREAEQTLAIITSYTSPEKHGIYLTWFIQDNTHVGHLGVGGGRGEGKGYSKKKKKVRQHLTWSTKGWLGQHQSRQNVQSPVAVLLVWSDAFLKHPDCHAEFIGKEELDNKPPAPPPHNTLSYSFSFCYATQFSPCILVFLSVFFFYQWPPWTDPPHLPAPPPQLFTDFSSMVPIGRELAESWCWEFNAHMHHINNN